MRVENLKRWHWALIGGFLGLVVAWTWGGLQDSGGFSEPTTVGADEFQRLLSDGPMQGHPRIKDITVHRDSKRLWVTMKVLVPDPKDPHPKNPRRYRYLREQLNATTPFMPDFRDSPTQTVMVRVNPSAISKTHTLSRHEDQGALALWVNGAAARVEEVAGRLHLEGWKIETGQWADPGGSAKMLLALRPANYQLVIVLSSKQDNSTGASELKLKLNGHDVPLSGPFAFSGGTTLKANVSQEWVVAGQNQLFEFSRATLPVKIWELRLMDPTYSVADYLAFVKQTRPDLGFSSAWWETGWVRYALCSIIGAGLFGGFAPLVVLIFTGSQRGRTQEPAYDLDRFKGEPAKKPSTDTPKDELDLTAFEANIAEGLRLPVAAQGSQPDSSAPAKLSGGSDHPADIQVEKTPEEYQGEFYPVARHLTHKHDQKPE